MNDAPAARTPLSGRPKWQIWGLLALFTGVVVVPLDLVHLPASFLLAAMIAGIAVQLCGGGIAMPRKSQSVAEALLGCLIASSITPVALATFADHVPLFLAVVLSVIAVSTTMSLVLFRMRLLPGTTAIWGLSPGAAQAMMLMSGPFGADTRLVAFLQYLRVVMVATIAPIVAQIWADPTVVPHAAVATSGGDTGGILTGLAIAATGLLIATRFPIAAGTFLIPLALGGILHATGLVQIVLPGWLMAFSYIALGWGIGLNFTLPVLRHALGVLPQVATATLILIGICGGIAVVLTRTMSIDPLTAYLATSPGGMSSVAVIAATSRVDLPFVISLQTVRFLLVLVLGPAISRFITVRLGGRA